MKRQDLRPGKGRRFKPLPLLLSVLLLIGALPACSADGAGPSAAESPSFSDVPSDAWYGEAVAWCQAQGVMNGVSDTSFDPDGPLTRAMMAAVLYRMEGSPAVSGPVSFSDAQPGQWYTEALTWVEDRGLMQGYETGAFGLLDPVTREQLALILWRYSEAPEGDPAALADREAVSGFALSAVDWAVAQAIVSPRENRTFSPQTPATRGEVAAALYAYQTRSSAPTQNEEDTSMEQLTLSFNGHTYTATWADNSSAQALRALLQEGPLTIEMTDYGRFEKVGPLGTSLPRNDQQITTSAGDIILYQGNQITVYYAQNSWNFTRLGRIDDPSGLQEALGEGTVTVTFSLQ